MLLVFCLGEICWFWIFDLDCGCRANKIVPCALCRMLSNRPVFTTLWCSVCHAVRSNSLSVFFYDDVPDLFIRSPWLSYTIINIYRILYPASLYTVSTFFRDHFLLTCPFSQCLKLLSVIGCDVPSLSCRDFFIVPQISASLFTDTSLECAADNRCVFNDFLSSPVRTTIKYRISLLYERFYIPARL